MARLRLFRWGIAGRQRWISAHLPHLILMCCDVVCAQSKDLTCEDYSRTDTSTDSSITPEIEYVTLSTPLRRGCESDGEAELFLFCCSIKIVSAVKPRMKMTPFCHLSDETKRHIFNTGNGELIFIRSIVAKDLNKINKCFGYYEYIIMSCYMNYKGI